MKKILVLLLVLAVAAGLFAQEGEWSLTGKVEIGTYVDFDNGNFDAAVTSSTYNLPYGDYDDWPFGQLGVNYTRDAIKIGLDFNYGGGIGGNLEYDGGNYKFQAAASLAPLMVAGTPSNAWDGRLWGYYKLLNGLIHLEAAYNSRDEKWWESDITALSDPLWTENHAFTKVDHDDFLLASVDLENLSFGVQMYNVFFDQRIKNFTNYTAVGGFGGFKAPAKRAAQGQFLIDDVLLNMVAGVKFTMQPVEVAAQFRFQDYSVYFGGKANVSALTIGLSFAAAFDPNVTVRPVGAGLNIGYEADAFGANLKGWLNYTKTGAQDNEMLIAFEPGFFYNVIPTHLRFQTDVGLYFTGGKVGGAKQTLNVNWAVQPQLFWNFLGTGAGNYYGFNTGMIVRFRLASAAASELSGSIANFGTVQTQALDVTFRFAF
jgi:hypothetical protein